MLAIKRLMSLSVCCVQEEILARLEAERRLKDAEASLGRIEHGICSENTDGKIAEEVKEEMMVDVKSLKRTFFTWTGISIDTCWFVSNINITVSHLYGIINILHHTI